MSYFIW